MCKMILVSTPPPTTKPPLHLLWPSCLPICLSCPCARSLHPPVQLCAIATNKTSSMLPYRPTHAVATMAQGASVAQGQGVVTHVRTTSELAAICDPNWGGVPRLEAIAYCQGFLTSFGQYHTLLYPPGGPSRPLFCVPVPGPSVAQSGLAFAAWARANVQHSNEPALDSLLRWAQGSFPCTSSARSTTSRSTR